MKYIIVMVFTAFITNKLTKALALWRETRNVKLIQTTVEKLLSKEKIELVETSVKKDVKSKDDLSEYKEFLKYKAQLEVEELEGEV